MRKQKLAQKHEFEASQLETLRIQMAAQKAMEKERERDAIESTRLRVAHEQKQRNEVIIAKYLIHYKHRNYCILKLILFIKAARVKKEMSHERTADQIMTLRAQNATRNEIEAGKDKLEFDKDNSDYKRKVRNITSPCLIFLFIH